MESTETQVEIPSPAVIPSAIPAMEMGHSLLALIQTHAQPNTEQITEPRTEQIAEPRTESLAHQIEAIAEAKSRQFDASQSHSLRMAEMYQSISELLDLIHERIINDIPVRPEPIEPLAQSMTAAFGELQQQLQASEERQLATIESTLKHWESKRESEAAGLVLEMQSSHVQAQIEVNRLLRVMWLGTGLAAVGAGLALFLLSN